MNVACKITIAILVVSAMAGCSILDSGEQELIHARHVDDVPQDAPVISYDNERIGESEAIQRAVDDAVSASDGNAFVEISSAEAEEARKTLEPLPVYEGDPGGYYIQKDDQTFVITFLKEQ